MSKPECSICIEPFNKSSRYKCKCPHCNNDFCRKCVQSYVLTCTEYTVRCMTCKKAWSNDTLDTYFTKTFRNVVLKKHREEVLLERERSLLPATQAEVKRILTIREKEAELVAISKQRKQLITEIRNLKYGLHYDGTKKEARVFTMKCPLDECRGFIDSSDMKCGICSIEVCNKCNESITDNAGSHKCKEENIQTALLLKKDSKACPSCATTIFKISGCNQMWCTQCHTTFNWDTLKCVNGPVHNPHYYEWINNNGDNRRAIGDVPCGGIVHIQELRTTLNGNKYLNDVMQLHRLVLHIQAVELPHYPRNTGGNNHDLRVKFLMKNITEEQFKITLQKNEKKRVRQQEIRDVLEAYVFAMIDMFNNIVYSNGIDTSEWLAEVSQLHKYINGQLKILSQRYKTSVPIISSTDLIRELY